MKKVTVELTVKLLIHMDETQELDEVIDDMDYSFTAAPDANADIEDSEITDYKVVDSR